MADNGDRLRSVVAARLESLERAGVGQLPKPRPRVASNAAIPMADQTEADCVQVPGSRSLSVVEHIPATDTVAVSGEKRTSAWQRVGGALFDAGVEPQVIAADAVSLIVLHEQVAGCTQCSELAAKRTQTVFGVGNERTRLCFMGEAPGADEDRLGEPFVGRAGQLLTKIIEACRLKREDVYILNMIKCRPPGNRNPMPEELANCRPFLERQLELIEPEFICCLGAVASHNLLKTTTPIGKLRGKLHAYRGAKVVCTFHPAYLLRNPTAKKDCWEDMKYLMREMGVEL